MKLPSSKFWFICHGTTAAKLYWYGSYDYESLSYAWSKTADSIPTIDFQNTNLENPTDYSPDHLFKQYPLVIARTHPFDYAFLQTHYPEYLI